MDHRMARGKWGERLAARHLMRHGLRIIERNWTVRRGELDIIALEQDTLVIVEVRTRQKGSMVSPEESVNLRKRRKLIALAEEYLASREIKQSQLRFDLVAVRYGPIGLFGSCIHYRGIFEADG
ncbi:MAG: YraN family protein [Candidatus Alcyoniella australis]|nr:YraN family protein [Candidatus Alcyoniella australis]